MKHKDILLVGSLLLLLANTAWSQRRTEPDADIEKYNSLASLGVTTNTNSGILGGIVARHSQSISGTFLGKQQFRYLAVELVNVKHPKELSSQNFVTGSRFTYGKQNYLFVLRPEYGREIMFFNRHADEGISISGIVAAGPSIGLEKPYMIQFQSRPGVIVNEPYDPAKHGQTELIVGSGSFFSGFDKMKIVPGLHLKTALSFELSAFRENMTGLEIGFIAEAFSRQIIIMPFADNRSFFTSGYVTLYFGNKK
ncbi:hypothetical protein [Arundinibacter roseus]|uniref:Outer membrane protein beta-barrel domain-containing protein n=1 Tax=Arundinibacter roseus TaxID=2070510 RepID=A0A4R4JYW4_9BACT|nr:hypothetical protein [Arundinibacter roseus]TDB60038.1 hypothetical protein EZE20_21435 [Arundinibacter roseus]